MEWTIGQEIICMGQLGQDCLAQKMGRMGSEISRFICTGPRYKNGMDFTNWEESLDFGHLLQVHLASLDRELDSHAPLAKDRHIISLEISFTLHLHHSQQSSLENK